MERQHQVVNLANQSDSTQAKSQPVNPRPRPQAPPSTGRGVSTPLSATRRPGRAAPGPAKHHAEPARRYPRPRPTPAWASHVMNDAKDSHGRAARTGPSARTQRKHKER